MWYLRMQSIDVGNEKTKLLLLSRSYRTINYRLKISVNSKESPTIFDRYE